MKDVCRLCTTDQFCATRSPPKALLTIHDGHDNITLNNIINVVLARLFCGPALVAAFALSFTGNALWMYSVAHSVERLAVASDQCSGLRFSFLFLFFHC